MLRAALADKAAEETGPVEEMPELVLPGRSWEPSMALAAGLAVLFLSSSISAIGLGVQSQSYPDETASHAPRG